MSRGGKKYLYCAIKICSSRVQSDSQHAMYDFSIVVIFQTEKFGGNLLDTDNSF